MKIVQFLVGLYLVIGLGMAIHGAYFGDETFRGLAWHLGRGLVWPGVMFPSFGKAVGGTLMVAIILAVLGLKK